MSHVHAYVPYYFYLLILKLFGAFLIVSLSLSLSLSLFLTLVASWHLNINPFRLGTLFVQEESSSSSPSNPTPSHVRFRDEKAKLDFSENFSRRGIHLEHQVVLSDFSDTDLPTVIYSRGWESPCGVSVMCPFMIIQ